MYSYQLQLSEGRESNMDEPSEVNTLLYSGSYHVTSGIVEV